MNGIKIKLPVAVTDTSLPKIYDDPILNVGSLFLFDPSHSLGESGTTIVNTGAANNIAWNLANETMGTSVAESSLKGVISLNNIDPSKAIIEMTSKKGVHGIISKVNTTYPVNWTMSLPDAIKTHLLTNWTSRKFFISVWGRVTRISDTSTSGFMLLANKSSTTSNLKSLFQANGTVGNYFGIRNPTGMNVLGNFIRNVETGNSMGVTPANIAGMEALLKIGPGNAYAASEAGKSQSMIIYRVYIEDLAVSGRTYAQVDAIDIALYNAAFATGGKYDADTFTAVSTLL